VGGQQVEQGGQPGRVVADAPTGQQQAGLHRALPR
jgi:hypothetical protein